MPAYVITPSLGRIGEAIDATFATLASSAFLIAEPMCQFRSGALPSECFPLTANRGGSFRARGETVPPPFWLMAAKVSATECGAPPWHALRSYCGNSRQASCR